MKTNNLLSCKYLCKIFIYLFLLFITTHIYAQTVNITGQDITLAKVFEEIENQTKLSVAYSESTIDKHHRVSVDIRNKPVDQAMDVILFILREKRSLSNRFRSFSKRRRRL